MITDFDFIKKYKWKLGRAWKNGCTDKQAAKYAGCGYDELKSMLEVSKTLREFRDARVDTILVKAQENVAREIADGNLKASEWYIEKMDYRFGGAKLKDLPDEEEESIDDFLDNFRAKGEFDDGK